MNSQTFYGKLKGDLLQWAMSHADVRAILIVGSQARKVKPADAYADLDLDVFITETSKNSDVFINWMREYAPVWTIMLEEWEDGTKNWLILYQGGIKVDFSIAQVGALQQMIEKQDLWDDMVRGYEILLDKDGLAAQLPPPKTFEPPAHVPPTREQFAKRIESYFYGAVYVAKQIKRGNLWKVKWADQIQQTMLLEMLEWHAHAAHGASIDTYYRGDFMRDWVNDATWREIHGVFAQFDAEDSWRAVLASIKLFSRLTQETANQLGYAYPVNMMDEVTAYIRALASGASLPQD
ncbi:MAG: aminoglycoside 6-adenylyltransferase [Anaerolineae bacterium]|nr:aminoglycoside 6-adenylyltransferase [Anaerolineae bacterium]